MFVVHHDLKIDQDLKGVCCEAGFRPIMYLKNRKEKQKGEYVEIFFKRSKWDKSVEARTDPCWVSLYTHTPIFESDRRQEYITTVVVVFFHLILCLHQLLST